MWLSVTRSVTSPLRATVPFHNTSLKAADTAMAHHANLGHLPRHAQANQKPPRDETKQG